jgi:hypothetical protein
LEDNMLSIMVWGYELAQDHFQWQALALSLFDLRISLPENEFVDRQRSFPFYLVSGRMLTVRALPPSWSPKVWYHLYLQRHLDGAIHICVCACVYVYVEHHVGRDQLAPFTRS